MIEFKENPLAIGEMEKGTTVSIVFEYTGDKEDIVFVKPGCNCTAEVDWISTPGQIKAVYTDHDTTSIDPKVFAAHYPSGVYSFVKDLTVYLKDDQDLTIIEGLEKQFNPKKTKIVLNFTGTVRLF